MHRLDREPITIGLLGHATGSANLGVGALTLAHVGLLEDAAAAVGRPVRFELAGWIDRPDPYVAADNLAVHRIGRSFILARRDGLAAMARRCDVVFDICAGDSFSDIYGLRRILNMFAAQGVVLAARTPLVLAPQTLGPFRNAVVKEAARRIMRRAALVVARDGLSSAYVAGLDRTIPLMEATDVAFELPFQPLPPFGDGRVHVGINVSGLLHAGGYNGRNDFDLRADYPSLMRALVARFAAMPDVVVHLVPHVVLPAGATGVEDDRRACEAIAAEFDGVIVEPAPTTPSAAKAVIARLDFFCGARMHATIAALSANVPVVPIAYSRKFKGLFETLGYPHVADCREHDGATILRMVLDGFARRPSLAVEAAAANAEARRRLATYRNAVTSVLGSIGERRRAA
jgi:polysaccharide pyruvyl transferase WcaK-like protein